MTDYSVASPFKGTGQLPCVNFFEMQATIEKIIDIYTKKGFTILNVYVVGSSRFVHSADSVKPRDLDLLLIVKEK